MDVRGSPGYPRQHQGEFPCFLCYFFFPPEVESDFLLLLKNSGNGALSFSYRTGRSSSALPRSRRPEIILENPFPPPRSLELR